MKKRLTKKRKEEIKRELNSIPTKILKDIAECSRGTAVCSETERKEIYCKNCKYYERKWWKFWVD